MGRNSRSKRSLSRLPRGLPVRGNATANPFEQGPQQKRPKHLVHNRGNIGASAATTPGGPTASQDRPSSLSSSLAMALKQRQQHVQADRQASKQSNVFLDRRLTAATPQEQVLQRLVKERLQGANSRRRTKFQLHDDDDGGGDDGESWRRRRKNGGGGSNSAGSDLLTHRGKALKDLSASDHVILSDAEEDYGDLEELDTDLHFGGGTGLLNPANPYGPNSGSGAGNNPSLLSAVYSRRKTELDDLILRRKIAKAEKLQSKEEQVDTFEKLDDAYGDLAPLLQFRDKRQMYPTEVDDEMADWDREVNTLMLKRKVAATNRTKTAEEIAKEEADRLHELETKRLARMNGDFEDDDLSDVSVADAAVSRYRGQSSAFPPAPEALDDDIVEKKRASEKQEFTMKFTADGLAKVDSQGDVIVEAAPTAKLSPSVIHAVGTRVSANYHASEQLEGYSAWYDGVIKRVYRDDDGSITYDIDYDDGDFEEGVEPKHVRLQNESKAVAKGTSAAQTQEDDKKVKLKRQKAKDQARSTIPFVFEVPTTLDALHDMIATHAKTGEDASLIIRRVHTANSVKLNRRNAEKMQNFYDVLLRRFVAVGDAIHQSGDGGPELGRFKQLDSLTHVLYLMAQDSADSAAAVWGRRLGFFQKSHAKRLRHADLESDDSEAATTAWPSTGVFLALRALGHVFPVTDQRHHIVTPAILFLGQIISHTPVASMYDLVMGILCSGLLIEYNKDAKRVVPEALAFLGGAIRLFAPDGPDRESRMFAHPALGDAASHSPFDAIRTEMVSFATKGVDEIPKLSLHKESIERSESCATAALASALDLISSYATSLLPLSSKECFAEVGNALIALQPRQKEQPLPKMLWGKLSEAVVAVEKHEKIAATRSPLQRRSATSVAAIKSLAPRLESAEASRKNRSRGDGNTEATALRHELQRESKAAKRELQWDATLVEQARRSEQVKRDQAAAAKRHKAFAWLEQKQGELNQQVRQGGGLLKGGGVGAARSKARTGKLGIKKGGKL